MVEGQMVEGPMVVEGQTVGEGQGEIVVEQEVVAWATARPPVRGDVAAGWAGAVGRCS